MAIIKNLDSDEVDEKLKKKNKRTSKKKEGSSTKAKTLQKIKPSKSPVATTRAKTKKDKGVNPFLVAIIILVIIVIVFFAFTQIQVNHLSGSEAQTEVLQSQVAALKNELKKLSDRAASLERENEKNQEIVIDLFDRNRKIPREVDTLGWQTFKNDKLGYQLNLPEDWEAINEEIVPEEQPAAPTSEEPKEGEDATPEEAVKPVVQYITYLQPKNQSGFTRIITIKNDYLDFESLPLNEKYDLFKGLNLLDVEDFAHGKLLYFLDVNDKNEVLPTILVLTDQHIISATFNYSNKSAQEYISYRQDFENIMATFTKLPPATQPDPVPAEPTDTPE